MENKKFELTKLNLGGKMENKKVKLCSGNLEAVSIMQNMVYINISTYRNLKNKDFNDKLIRDNFELICDNYIRLRMTPFINYYRGELCEKINKYKIQSNINVGYNLIIDLEKDYHDCVKMSVNVDGRESEPVLINIFNVKFEAGY